MSEQGRHTAHVATIKARLEPRIRAFAVAVQAGLPAATVTTHLLATASFPWWAVVSVCRSTGTRDEVVVLDVAYWRSPTRVQLSCDLSTGDGVVVAELSERAFAAEAITDDGLARWIDQVVAFIAAQVAPTIALGRQRGA